MKTKYVKLFEEYLNESVEHKLLTDPIEVEKWLATWKDEMVLIPNLSGDPVDRSRLNGTYIIRPNGIVDVTGNVFLRNKELKNIPIQFGNVSGLFDCSNNKLKSFKGCPIDVVGSFDCYFNPKLTTLQYCPTSVGKNFNCHNNKNLITYEHCQTSVGGNFNCYHNLNIISNGLEAKVAGSIIYSEMHGTIEQRYQRYSAYLSKLSPEDKANSISWLLRVDEELWDSFIQHAIENNLTDIYSDRVVRVNKNIRTRQNKRMPLL